MSEQARSLKSSTAAFSDDMNFSAKRIERCNEDLYSQMRETFARGDVRMETILDHSYSVLSELQFQDPCAQLLGKIDGELEALARRVSSDAGESEEKEGARESSYNLGNGEVLLF
jgi:predicted Zn-dependent protease with MMP-like domain